MVQKIVQNLVRNLSEICPKFVRNLSKEKFKGIFKGLSKKYKTEAIAFSIKKAFNNYVENKRWVNGR